MIVAAMDPETGGIEPSFVAPACPWGRPWRPWFGDSERPSLVAQVSFGDGLRAKTVIEFRRVRTSRAVGQVDARHRLPDDCSRCGIKPSFVAPVA
jgi:hypothetical protein